MKKAIELADSTFRAYKKKNSAIVLHLRTFIIVYADKYFLAKIQNATPSLNPYNPRERCGLTAFFQEHPRCWIRLSGHRQFEGDVSYGTFPVCDWVMHPAAGASRRQAVATDDCTLFHFFVKLSTHEATIAECSIADMKLEFQINFPGRREKEKIIMRRKIPIVRRGRGW